MLNTNIEDIKRIASEGASIPAVNALELVSEVERLRAAAEAPVVASALPTDIHEAVRLMVAGYNYGSGYYNEDSFVKGLEKLFIAAGVYLDVEADEYKLGAAPASPAAPVAPAVLEMVDTIARRDATIARLKAEIERTMKIVRGYESELAVLHPDDAAVNRFAVAMKGKMAAGRAKGRGGWDDPEQCTASDLRGMLAEHLRKGDPVGVGNFAMMLWSRAESTAAAPVAQPADEREAFEAWHRSKFATKHSTGQPTRDMHNGIYAEKYGPENQQLMWEVWQAARATPAAPLAQQSEPAGDVAINEKRLFELAKHVMHSHPTSVKAMQKLVSFVKEHGAARAENARRAGYALGRTDEAAQQNSTRLYAGSAPASPVPEGWQIVPKKLMPEMLAQFAEFDVFDCFKGVPKAVACVSNSMWECALRVAPAAPASTGPCSDDTAKARLVTALKLAKSHLDYTLDGPEFRKVFAEIDAALSAAEQGGKA